MQCYQSHFSHVAFPVYWIAHRSASIQPFWLDWPGYLGQVSLEVDKIVSTCKLGHWCHNKLGHSLEVYFPVPPQFEQKWQVDPFCPCSLNVENCAILKTSGIGSLQMSVNLGIFHRTFKTAHMISSCTEATLCTQKQTWKQPFFKGFIHLKYSFY